MKIDNMALIKAFTRKSVLERPDIPDEGLMIGYTENLDSVNLRIPQSTVPKGVARSVIKMQETCSNDQLNAAIAGNIIEVNDVSLNIALLQGKLGVYND